MSDSGQRNGECEHGHRLGYCQLCKLYALVDELTKKLRSVMGVIQRYQPGGSPPPGDELCLAEWVLRELHTQQQAARWRVEELEGFFGMGDPAHIANNVDQFRLGLCSVIGTWLLFHAFVDDCGYPCLSPSDQVLEDLHNRLRDLLAGKNVREVEEAARERWHKLPWSKGQARYLRRRHPHDNPGVLTMERALRLAKEKTGNHETGRVGRRVRPVCWGKDVQCALNREDWIHYNAVGSAPGFRIWNGACTIDRPTLIHDLELLELWEIHQEDKEADGNYHKTLDELVKEKQHG